MTWIVKSIGIYSLFIVLTAFVYIVLIPYIFPVMIDDKFIEALLYIPLLVIAFSVEGLRKPLSGFLMYKNMVKTLGVVSLITAAINIILNILLIQEFGIIGAVYATLYSFLFLYVITLFLVYKYCDIRLKN